MKVLKILIIMLVLIMSVGAVCAADGISSDDMGNDTQNIPETLQEDNILETSQDDVYAGGESSFTDLYHEISNSTDVLQITQNYKFDNETDRSDGGIEITKSNLVIEGNGYTIDGNGQSRIFVINASNVTIKNLNFINAKSDKGSAMFLNPDSSLTTDSVVFENNTAEEGVIYVSESTYDSNNDKFLDSTVSGSGVIRVAGAELKVDNALMRNSKVLSFGFIQSSNSVITVLNSMFRDTVSNYSAAIRADGKSFIKNCTFINLEAVLTGGAIAVREVDECVIEDCTFVNVSSHKNGGAIFSDIMGYQHSNEGLLLINGTTFFNCSSGFGGVLLHLGGDLIIDNSKFIYDYSSFDGGAVYVAYSNVTISNSLFTCNSALSGGDGISYGGAIYCDISTFNLRNSNFTTNFAHNGSAIYLYDSDYVIANNVFDDNINFEGRHDDVFSVFDVGSLLENNTCDSDESICINNVNYATIVDFEGMDLVLLNNTIDVTELPTRFDLRDWNWVTPVRDQGRKGACWTFGSSGAMESSILRFLGIEMDLSENNMEDLSLVYYKYGVKGLTEGNVAESAANYALSWLGVFSSDYDAYDQIGKISPIFAVPDSIHFQDVVILPPRQNASDNNALKEAILKYGALFVYYYSLGSPDVEQYYDGPPQINHGVSLVGWDDNREIAGAPDKGAWIIKNSWGESAGEKGYMYISYYDTSLSTDTYSYAFLLENTIKYNKNYQYDISGTFHYLPSSNQYLNRYVAIDDDLLAAVGTYFNDTNVEYTIKIYVNDELKLVQNGLSPFPGFHTVKLDSYIPIKEGDEFAVEINSNCIPALSESRQHYIQGTSQAMVDGEWDNITDDGVVCCIKAYTVDDDTVIINNKDIAVDYAGGKYFTVQVVTADGHAVGEGITVKFTINGKNAYVTTDKDGIARLKINMAPGAYAIKTTLNGKTQKNVITVKHVLKTSKVTVKKSAKSFVLKANLKINGKLQKGKKVTFTFRGKSYKAITTKYGNAYLVVNKNVMKYLKKGKSYLFKVTYGKDTIKSTVTVR